jgi:hypothetical protein
MPLDYWTLRQARNFQDNPEAGLPARRIILKFLDDSGRFPYAPPRDTSPQREATIWKDRK